MKKEAIIAVILGVFFGAFLGFFLINKNKEISFEKNKTLPSKSAINQMTNKKNQIINFIPLEIKEPNDYFITDKDNIDIIGKATKESLIIIQSSIKDIVYKNTKEDFKINVPLVLGENIIKIVDYPKDKSLDSQEKTLRIYYLKIEL